MDCADYLSQYTHTHILTSNPQPPRTDTPLSSFGLEPPTPRQDSYSKNVEEGLRSRVYLYLSNAQRLSSRVREIRRGERSGRVILWTLLNIHQRMGTQSLSLRARRVAEAKVAFGEAKKEWSSRHSQAIRG